MGYETIKIEVKETAEELLLLVQKERDALLRKRLIAIYLYRNGSAKSSLDISKQLVCSRRSVSKWFQMYADGGIEEVLSIKYRGTKEGTIRAFSKEAVEALEKELSNPENNLDSFIKIQHLLSEKSGKPVKYSTAWNFTRNKLKAKLKVQRPYNIKKDAQKEEDIKKKLKQSPTKS